MGHPRFCGWERKARTDSRSPFGFAQGRLFGDDNKKGKGEQQKKQEQQQQQQQQILRLRRRMTTKKISATANANCGLVLGNPWTLVLAFDEVLGEGF
jgi:hypothetical protein